MLQELNREWGNVLATAVNEKKREEEKKRSALKVAEAHKRKERDRKSLLSLIRVSASPSSFREPKHEPTFLFLLLCLFKNIFFIHSVHIRLFFIVSTQIKHAPSSFFVIFYVPFVIQFVSQKGGRV